MYTELGEQAEPNIIGRAISFVDPPDIYHIGKNSRELISKKNITVEELPKEVEYNGNLPKEKKEHGIGKIDRQKHLEQSRLSRSLS